MASLDEIGLEMQPRDRSRSASQEQIAHMAANLMPELLMPAPQSAEGASIVGPDRVVESGNARTLAIRRAYELGMGERYRDFLAAQGYDVEGFERPVLVSRRTTELSLEDRVAFAREANARTTADRGAAEIASSDAASLTGDLLGMFQGGDVAMAGNRDFVRQFMQAVVPDMERAAMMSATGELSQAGKTRIENAVFFAAYGDPELLAVLREDLDSDVKSIGGAMLDAAPEWAQMRAGVADGTVEAIVDATDNILGAVRLVRKARSEGTTLSDLVAQQGMFAGDVVEPETEIWLRMMFRNPGKLTGQHGRARIAEGMKFWASEALKQGAGPNIFGETVDQAEVDRMMEFTHRRIAGEEAPQIDALAARAAARRGPDLPRAGEGGAGQAAGAREPPGWFGGPDAREGRAELRDNAGDFEPLQLGLLLEGGGTGTVPAGSADAPAAPKPSRPVHQIAKADVLALENVRVGLSHVRSPEDAAHIAAPFRKEPQESAIAVVLDGGRDEIHEPIWRDGGKSAGQWQSSLQHYAFPRLKAKPGHTITTADVMAILLPIWTEKAETARRVDAVSHDVRSTFRDWCSESAHVPQEVAGACLAHAVKGVEGDYARSDLLDCRRKLMDRWAAYLATDAGDTIVPMARSSREANL